MKRVLLLGGTGFVGRSVCERLVERGLGLGGLAGRDFDRLARAMAPEYRVVCPDVVGRGRSDYLRDPMHYIMPQYVADMVTLIARLNVEQVDWVGTSMGGLIGIGLAYQHLLFPPRRPPPQALPAPSPEPTAS